MRGHGDAGRRRRHRAWWRAVGSLAVVGSLAAGCGALGGPGTGPNANWARDAEVWIGAYDSAAAAWDGVGPSRAHEFYAAEVLFNDRRTQFYGRRTVAAIDVDLARVLARHDFGEPYLDSGGVLRAESLVWRRAGSRPVATARVWDVTPDGIARMQAFTWLQEGLVRNNPTFAHARKAADELASAYVDAWATADRTALGDLYAADATLVDDLTGRKAAGREEIVALARPGTGVPARLVLAEELHADDVLAPTSAPPGSPAVYVTWSYLQPVENPQVVGPPLGPRPAQVLLFRRSLDDCPGASAVVLTVDGAGHVVSERRFHELGSVRACTARPDLRRGWWAGMPLPLPLSERVTGSIESAQGRVTVRNGTPELEDLVRWGLGRYAAAGLPPPRVRSVVFDPYSPRCGQYGGYADVSFGSTSLLICAEAPDIGRSGSGPLDPPCAGTACPAAGAQLRGLMLHELGHGWLSAHADQAERDRFSAAVGALAWDDDAVPREQRGVELAASTLAWGLGGVRDLRPDLPDVPCRSLAEAFRLLTDRPALTACG